MEGNESLTDSSQPFSLASDFPGGVLEGLSSVSPEVISDYILNETKLTSNVVSQLLQGENNVLKANITTLINNGLAKKISSKKCIGQLVITEKLTTDQRINLTQAFTELDITFTDTNQNSHAYAAASRKCERAVLLKKIGMDLSSTKHRIRVKEVGGDIVSSVTAGECDIHCCSPILDVYDSKRLSQRVHRAIGVINGGVVLTNYATETLIEYINVVTNQFNSKSEVFCFNKSQECNIKAEAVLFLHSIYDMSLRDVADTMVKAKALIGYGSFIFDSRIFENDTGFIDILDVDYNIQRDRYGKRKSIRFGFRHCSGYNYSHNYKDYISVLTKSQIVSSTGERFAIELLENRNGVQFFSIVRLMVPKVTATYHRLYFKHLDNKYIVRFPKLCYDFSGQTTQTFYADLHDILFKRRYPGKDSSRYDLPTSSTIGILGSKNKYKTNDLVKDAFWEALPSTTQWMTFAVDKDIVDRTCAFVLVATEEKFKPEQILSYLRSITTREVMYTSVASKSKLPHQEELIALAHAIYIVLYQQKYVNGKILQQAISETNALRRNGIAVNNLDEFSQRLSVFNWLLVKLGMKTLKLFDPMKFIIEPPTYLEIKTDEFMRSSVVDEDWDFFLNLDDLIVVEDFGPVDEKNNNSSDIKVYPKESFCSPAKSKKNQTKFCKFKKPFKAVMKFLKPISIKESTISSVSVCSSYSEISREDNLHVVKAKDLEKVNKPEAPNKSKPFKSWKLMDYLFEKPLRKKAKVEETQFDSSSDGEIDYTEDLSFKLLNREIEIGNHDTTDESQKDNLSVNFTSEDSGINADITLLKEDRNIETPTPCNLSSKCSSNDFFDAELLTTESTPTFDSINHKNECQELLPLELTKCLINNTEGQIINIKGSRYINVSALNNECCFRAVFENRLVDVDKVRKNILNGVTNKDKQDVARYSELCDEMTPGNMAGSAFLENFSNMYNVSVVVNYLGDFHRIEPKNFSAKVRTINLMLMNHHYYYKLTCKEDYEENYIQHKGYNPYDVLAVKTLLKNKGLQFKFFKNDVIDSKNETQTYYINNLDHYCPLHIQCRNNNLYKYCKALTTNFNNKYILSFERDNFDSSLAYETLELFECNLTPIDISYSGYIFMMLYKVKSKCLIDFRESYKNFLLHKCSNGNDKGIIGYDSGFIRTCFTKMTIKLAKPELLNDFTIVIQRSNCDALVEYRDHSKMILNGKGSYTNCENLSDLILKYLSIFGKFDFVVHTRLKLVSDYSNVAKFVQLLKNRSYSLVVEINKCELLDMSIPMNFLPDDTDLNKMKNAMKEIHLMWTKEYQVIENQLKMHYDNYISSKLTNGSSNIIVDNSVVVLDINSCKFVYGHSLNPPYNFAYSSEGLVNISEFFNFDGSLNLKVIKSYNRKRNTNNHIGSTVPTPYFIMNSASKLVHGLALSQRHSFCEIDTFKPVKLTFVQGVPGAGKTEYILNRNNKARNNNLILTVTKEAQRDMIARARSKNLKLTQERIRTLDSFLLNYTTGTMIIDQVWMDEALLAHCGTWLWVMMLSRCTEMYVVGDRAQIPYINRNGLEHAYSIPRFDTAMEYLTIDYRNPLDIVLWLKLNKFYKFDITGTSSIIHSVGLVEVSGVSDIPNKSDTKYLTFTQSEKAIMVSKGFDAYTIHEYQGSQYNNISLVRLTNRDTDVIYKSVPHILVGLTRHRTTFTYYTTLPSDTLSKYIRDILQYPDFEIQQVKIPDLRGGGFSKHRPVDPQSFEQQIIPDKSLVLFKQNKDVRNILLDSHGTGYIPFIFKNTYNYITPTIEMDFKPTGEVNILQEFNDRVFPGSSIEFNQFDHDIYEYTPVLLSGDVTVSQTLPVFKKYDCLQPVLRTSIQKPLHQSTKVSLKAFLERNGNVPCIQGTIDEFKESQKLFTKFKLLLNHNVNFKKYPVSYNYTSLEEWLYSQPPNVKKIIMSEEKFFDQKFSSYEFIIKTIPKIDLEIGAQFRYKSPQTIAFQKKTLNSVFCPLLKDFMDRVIYSLDPNIVLYNAMSPQEFAKHFTNIFPPERYRSMHKFLEVDFSKFDKSQGLVILMFEALLLEYFGVPLEYVKLWIIMHRYTTIIDKVNGFKANVEYQRKSGDAGTWRMNTLVQIAILNSVYDLWAEVKNNNCVACFSGDDSLIFLRNNIFDIENKTFRLQTLYNMEAKLMNYNIPYFCSKFLIIVEDEWIFVPDTMKLIIKLGRADMVDYEHVECYRISYLDNLYYYKEKKNWTYISYALNDRYKLTGEHDIVYSALLALASDRSAFESLYIKPLNFDARKSKITIKPKLDL